MSVEEIKYYSFLDYDLLARVLNITFNLENNTIELNIVKEPLIPLDDTKISTVILDWNLIDAIYKKAKELKFDE